jgi:hypothetical protein
MNRGYKSSCPDRRPKGARGEISRQAIHTTPCGTRHFRPRAYPFFPRELRAAESFQGRIAYTRCKMEVVTSHPRKAGNLRMKYGETV